MEDRIDLSALKLEAIGHARDLGLRYIDHGEDWAEIALDYEPRLAMDRATGTLASGPIISLIDNASGLAIMVKVRKARPMATLDLRIDYMRAAAPGRSIVARATCTRVTRNVAFVRCVAHDGDPDDLVAHSISSFFFTAD